MTEINLAPNKETAETLADVALIELRAAGDTDLADYLEQTPTGFFSDNWLTWCGLVITHTQQLPLPHAASSTAQGSILHTARPSPISGVDLIPLHCPSPGSARRHALSSSRVVNPLRILR